MLARYCPWVDLSLELPVFCSNNEYQWWWGKILVLKKDWLISHAILWN